MRILQEQWAKCNSKGEPSQSPTLPSDAPYDDIQVPPEGLLHLVDEVVTLEDLFLGPARKPLRPLLFTAISPKLYLPNRDEDRWALVREQDDHIARIRLANRTVAERKTCLKCMVRGQFSALEFALQERAEESIIVIVGLLESGIAQGNRELTRLFIDDDGPIATRISVLAAGKRRLRDTRGRELEVLPKQDFERAVQFRGTVIQKESGDHNGD
jgi:hypothetical protein